MIPVVFQDIEKDSLEMELDRELLGPRRRARRRRHGGRDSGIDEEQGVQTRATLMSSVLCYRRNFRDQEELSGNG